MRSRRCRKTEVAVKNQFEGGGEEIEENGLRLMKEERVCDFESKP